MRIGIGVGAGTGEEGTIGHMIRQVQRAEESGFDAVWVANIFGVDAITFLALAGRETATIELGTGVVPTYPRHPTAMAQQALTAAAASDNRFTLGIGLSHKVVIENMMGLDYSKPIRHTREYLSVLMPLLEGKQAMFRGEEYRVAAQITVAGANRPPVLVAALGPQMLKLVGKMADGTITWMGGPKYLAETAIPAIRAAAAEAGRPAPRIVAGFPVAVTVDATAARATASKVFAVYGTLPSYRAVLDVEGAADASGVAIVGTEEEVETQIRALAASGVTDFNASAFPVEGDPNAVARTFEFLSAIAREGVS
jgi:F420-dependent oxidoreductase-like protein